MESATGRVASVIEQKTNGALAVRELPIALSDVPANTSEGGKAGSARRVVAMSSSRNQIADFGAVGQGAMQGVVVVSDLETGRQSKAALSGEPIGKLFAATYRGLDDSYYVVDVEAGRSSVRLFRVDSRWNTTVAAQWPRTRDGSYMLTTGDSGELLLTSLLEEGFAVVVLESSTWGAWGPSVALSGADLAAAPARLSSGQLGIAVVRGGLVEAVSVPLTRGRSRRLAASRADAGFVGLRKCNIAEAF